MLIYGALSLFLSDVITHEMNLSSSFCLFYALQIAIHT